MEPKTYQSLAMAIKDFFGVDLQTARKDFLSLTPQDKVDLREEFAKVGITISEAKAA